MRSKLTRWFTTPDNVARNVNARGIIHQIKQHPLALRNEELKKKRTTKHLPNTVSAVMRLHWPRCGKDEKIVMLDARVVHSSSNKEAQRVMHGCVLMAWWASDSLERLLKAFVSSFLLFISISLAHYLYINSQCKVFRQPRGTVSVRLACK